MLRAAHLESACLHYPDIGWQPIPELDLNNVPDGQLLRLDVQLLPLPGVRAAIQTLFVFKDILKTA